MLSKRRHPYPKRSGKRKKSIAQERQLYQFPGGHAHIYVVWNPYRILILLDSGSNILLINKTLVHDLNIHYASRTDSDAIPIQGFIGETISTGGSHYTHSLYQEIGQNHHRFLVSCEIAPPGTLYQQHCGLEIMEFHWRLLQIAFITAGQRQIHWVRLGFLNNPNAVAIGRIEDVDDEMVTILDQLPEVYHHYLHLFRPSTAEKLSPHLTFDYAIDIKSNKQPPYVLFTFCRKTNSKPYGAILMTC